MSTTHTRMTGQERRAAIISAAVKLFAERGFRGTTTREIAAAVGVSEPVLYQHFSTKRELYDAIIEAKMQECSERADCPLQSFLDAQDDRAFFTRLAEMILWWYEHDPAYVRLLLYSGLEGHELSDLFHQHASIRSYHQVVIDYIRRRVESGAFGGVDPELAARAFAGTVANYGLRSVILRCQDKEETRRRMIDTVVRIFLEGIKNRDGNS